LEEDLVPALRSLSNVFDGVVGAGNYWETIQDATEMADSDRPEARTFLIRDLGAAARGTAANPRLKQKAAR